MTTWPEASVLNRIVRWHPRKEIANEADPRHAEVIIRDSGAENLKTIPTPAMKETGREKDEVNGQDLNGCRWSGKLGGKSDDDDNGDTLSADEATTYWRIAARANFVAQDRMDIAYATKEATRRMTASTKDDWNKLVRLGSRVVNWYKYQNASEKVGVHRLRLGRVLKDKQINVQRMLPQKTAHA